MAIRSTTVARRSPRRPHISPLPQREPTRPGAAVPPHVATESEQRHAMIADAAYFRAAARGFAPGHESEDWLDAEREIDERLFSGEIGLY